MNGEINHKELEDIPALVLGGLGAEEEEKLWEHVGSCELCQRELASYEPLRHALNLAVDDVPMPAGARERFMEQTGGFRDLSAGPSGVRTEAPREHRTARHASHGRSWLPWTLAAASLLVAMLLGGSLYAQNRTLGAEVAEQQETISSVVDLMERADLRVEDLPTGDSEARVRVYAAREGDVGMFVFDRLPPLPEGSVYQLWVGDEDGLTSPGTFTPTFEDRGSYHKLLSPPGGFDQYERVEVAVVPEGGLDKPPSPSDPAWIFQSELPASMQASRI